MKTIECAEVMCWSASAVSSGKPTTTPSATIASEAGRSRPGASAAAASSSAAPSSAAITARAEVRNSGVKPPTATRVAGSEPLKMMTPRRPLPHPVRRPLHRALLRRVPAIARRGLAETATVTIQFDQTVWMTGAIQLATASLKAARRDAHRRRSWTRSGGGWRAAR